MSVETLLVKMAEIEVAENSKLLKTTLGSCVGVILHDEKRSISGLAHIMLPQRFRQDPSVGKYADTAIPALINRIVSRGGRKENMRAFITGGANMFKASGDRKIATIGEKNVEATRQILARLGVPIVFDETGGDRGRTVLFDTRSGKIQIKTLEAVAWKGVGG
jgi:chemotaxis protein CheD